MVKRILGVVVLAVLALVGVVVVRAALFTSKQVAVEPAPAVDVDTDAAVQRLSRAVQFKTVSYQDPDDFDGEQFQGLERFLVQAFPLVHQHLEKETVNRWSLLYTWQGTDPSLNSVLLMAHLDVVPVVPGTEGNWDQDAFSGAVVDGWVYGRGTMDDKVSAMAILEAIEGLLRDGKQPKRTVLLSFGHDEEVGGNNGASAVAAELQKLGVQAEFVLDEGGAIVTGAMPGLDGPAATIGVAEKGYLSVRLTAHAEGGHSSQPPPETAIGILSKAVVKLQNHQMPASIDGLTAEMLQTVGPEMNFGMKSILANLWLFSPLLKSQFAQSPVMNAFMRTTTAPTIIEGGAKENVLPPEASAVVNFRILPGDTTDDVIAHVQQVVADDRVSIEPLMTMASDPSKVSPSDGPVFAMISRTVREVVPDAVVTPYLVIGGTDARHFEPLSDRVYRFLPMTIEADDLKRMHGANERISVDAYATMIRFYRRLLVNAAL